MKERAMLIISLTALAITLTTLVYFILISANFKSVASYSNLNIYSKAGVFDTKFHDLTQEHTFLLIDLLRRSLSSSNAFNASYDALQINIKEIAAQLGDIYGTDAANQYLSIQESKINYFIQYTNALANNESNAETVFDSNIANYENNIATFWSNPDNPLPTLNYTVMRKLATDHANNIKEAVDSWNRGDYTNYFIKLHDSYTQMGVYADVIANAIIMQHPEIFK